MTYAPPIDLFSFDASIVGKRLATGGWKVGNRQSRALRKGFGGLWFVGNNQKQATPVRA
jgi:hypothetical protein